MSEQSGFDSRPDTHEHIALLRSLAHFQAQEIERLREALRPYAADRCDKFPKEQQPCEWNCQSIRADHRENAAEYTDESNERAEMLCRSCRVREALSTPSPTSSAAEEESE